MDFTIVTPSFRQLDWLELCVASVADQKGVVVEHIVQDAGTAGFEEFSQKMAETWPDRDGYRRNMISEPDQGMYDAINRGLKKGTGTFCAYLNCDEQYLPGILERVFHCFENSPETDLFLGDVVVVGPQGKPICHRKMVRPILAHAWTCHLPALTAGIFFRRSLLDQGIFFDTSYRAAADAAWCVRVLSAGLRFRTLGWTTSTFMDEGNNLGLSPAAQAERVRLTRSAPFWMRIFRPFWVMGHRMRRLAAGAYFPSNLSYEIHVPGSSARQSFSSKNLRATWPKRMWGF